MIGLMEPLPEGDSLLPIARTFSLPSFNARPPFFRGIGNFSIGDAMEENSGDFPPGRIPEGVAPLLTLERDEGSEVIPGQNG